MRERRDCGDLDGWGDERGRSDVISGGRGPPETKEPCRETKRRYAETNAPLPGDQSGRRPPEADESSLCTGIRQPSGKTVLFPFSLNPACLFGVSVLNYR